MTSIRLDPVATTIIVAILMLIAQFPQARAQSKDGRRVFGFTVRHSDVKHLNTLMELDAAGNDDEFLSFFLTTHPATATGSKR